MTILITPTEKVSRFLKRTVSWFRRKVRSSSWASHIPGLGIPLWPKQSEPDWGGCYGCSAEGRDWKEWDEEPPCGVCKAPCGHGMCCRWWYTDFSCPDERAASCGGDHPGAFQRIKASGGFKSVKVER